MVFSCHAEAQRRSGWLRTAALFTSECQNGWGAFKVVVESPALHGGVPPCACIETVILAGRHKRQPVNELMLFAEIPELVRSNLVICYPWFSTGFAIRPAPTRTTLAIAPPDRFKEPPHAVSPLPPRRGRSSPGRPDSGRRTEQPGC